MLQITVLNHFF